MNLENFSKNSQNWGQNLEILLHYFSKSWISLLVFIVAYHLHIIGASIGFYRTSLTLLVQEKRSAENGQKRIFRQFLKKKSFFTGFYQKSFIIDPLYFLASAMVNTCQKLSILEKKSKITKKFLKKSWLFGKIWFLWLQLLRIFGDLYMRLPYVLLEL